MDANPKGPTSVDWGFAVLKLLSHDNRIKDVPVLPLICYPFGSIKETPKDGNTKPHMPCSKLIVAPCCSPNIYWGPFESKCNPGLDHLDGLVFFNPGFLSKSLLVIPMATPLTNKGCHLQK